MNKTLLAAILLLATGITACNKEPQPLTKAQINQKIDSIVAARVKEIDRQSAQDLDHRIKIEVKVKADSIVNALKQKNTDTLAKNKPGIR